MQALPPNYAKCVNVINSSPDSLLVTVTYKDSTGQLEKSRTISAGGSSQFTQENREVPGRSFNSVIPVHKVTVTSDQGGKLEHLVAVTGVQGCVDRTVASSNIGYIITEGLYIYPTDVLCSS